MQAHITKTFALQFTQVLQCILLRFKSGNLYVNPVTGTYRRFDQ